MNQQQPQTPPTQQVPDHRMDELMHRIRTLETQNTQLRQTVDFVTQNKAQATQQQESNFKPEVQAELVKLIQAQINPVQEQFRNQVGLIFDQTDEAKFRLQYGDQKFQKFHDKVDSLRKDMQAQGRWIPREEALRIVYFEETGKKAAPEAPAAPAAAAPAKFDPYFGTFVDQSTGLPVQQATQVAQEPTTEGQMGMPWQQAPQAPTQQPQQQWQQPMPQSAQYNVPQQGAAPGGQRPGHNLNPTHPYANPFGQLPSQGMSPQHNVPPTQQIPREISLESSDADLEAFASKFGDIPL